MITVLIVDHAAGSREYLGARIDREPEFQVIGRVAGSQETVAFLQQRRPDVIAMELNLPRAGAIATIRTIMETLPVPVLVMGEEAEVRCREQVAKALDAGAVAYARKPTTGGTHDDAGLEAGLLTILKSVSQVKLVQRRSPAPSKVATVAPWGAKSARFQLVVIGASTGGPSVLKFIVDSLPEEFPIPLAIVQHISSGFTDGFAHWLGEGSRIQVHVAEHGMKLAAGHAYIAPNHVHMEVTPVGAIALVAATDSASLCPSVSHLFRSAMKSYGRHLVGVLLTGMGEDGAKELKEMRELGAVTITQDKDSSLIHGMPGEAIKLGAAMHILPYRQIAAKLAMLVRE